MRYGDHAGLPRGYRLWGEAMLDSFVKFNSNSGWYNPDFPSMQAFSHYSWIKSNGNLVICDLQGEYEGDKSRYILSDPAISSVRQRFGSTDLGVLGIMKFMMTHQCVDQCSRLGKPPKQLFKATISRFENLLGGVRLASIRGTSFGFNLRLPIDLKNAITAFYVEKVVPIIRDMSMLE
jgi:hypothetical protein